MSNQHTAQAILRLRNGTHNEVARAHVEATIALAYEQRTANLIALYGTADLANALERAQWDRALSQITERLDLA